MNAKQPSKKKETKIKHRKLQRLFLNRETYKRIKRAKL